MHGTPRRAGPILGNNPLAYAAPSAPGVPLPSLDIATSVVAWGRVAAAARDERDIPEAWAMGPDGRPTTAPDRALEGALLPMGDYKGFGLAFMNDVLTACVTGATGSPSIVYEGSAPEMLGHCLITMGSSASVTAPTTRAPSSVSPARYTTPRGPREPTRS